MDTINWILTGVNAVLLTALAFLINKAWDKNKEEKQEDDADREKLWAKSTLNTDHIAAFRSEVGILNTDAVNKITALKNVQDSMQVDFRTLTKEVRDLDVFLREHFSNARGK